MPNIDEVSAVLRSLGGRRRGTASGKNLLLICAVVILCLVTIDTGVFGQTRVEQVPQTMHKTEDAGWLTAWAMAPQRNAIEKISFENQTLRQIVFVGSGGEGLRVRLSNVYGPEALTIDRASIGLQRRKSQIVPASLHELTFNAQSSITLPVGTDVLSDPVNLTVEDNSHIAISLYFKQQTKADGWHRRSFQRSYVFDGDATDKARVKPRLTTTVWHWLSAIDVFAGDGGHAIVAIGDSTTDGYELSLGKNQGWVDVLQQRLWKTLGGEPRHSVLNLGIGGNRLLHDTDDLGFGGKLLDRLERDVFSQTAVSHVIVLVGINDIGLPVTPPEELLLPEKIRNERVTSAQLITGLKSVIERVREQGIGVIGATILPFEGAAYFTENGERTRQAVNDWIRQGAAFDSFIDFDVMLRDPGRPARLLPAYDGGDHLHPNARGHRVMAEGIDLQVFR